MFRKVLIANRGVIAARILKTLREHDISPVSVYTPGDEKSLHLTGGGDRICIRSYNDIPEIISVSRQFGAEAIHPGVGFLSENRDFARVANHYSRFIGPPTSLFVKMGNKVKARLIAEEAGLPTTPGSTGPVKNERDAFRICDDIGFPVIIKAAEGGGGMGMERVTDEADLSAALKRVRSQAKTLFGNDEVFIEKLIEPNRHIEVQVLADEHGTVVHLGERDCSIQRRHQKLIEFSPADISDELRSAITEAACTLTRAVGYTNAGTVEFLVDEAENFYFMEMNTRIQVEHRVTELVYGKDLIFEQIRIASGERLGYSQADLKQSGFAVECRINAEDPEHDFEASPGIIDRFIPPEGKHVAVDTFIPLIENGEEPFAISTVYDSLLANLVVWGKDKRSALLLMAKKLKEFVIEGKDVKTTIPFHQKKLEELSARTD
ncbi:MAG: ATP-grasp domain-containing protein [Spirochaetes bacterium]|nr:ATP-grasp domain-containing protein [Spirochaetota bacterium]